MALRAIGRAPVHLGARDPARAAALSARLDLPVGTPQQALDADWVFVCVKDDAIAPLCAGLRWQGQLAIHCSGATELDALAPATRRAGFHPLQLFADPLPTPDAALAAFRGIRVGIEGDADGELAALARALGAECLPLRAGERARYHAAANAAASGLLAPLSLATQAWQQALGLNEGDALAALLPLAQGTLAAVARQGLAGALSGPLARGDESVLRRHLSALEGTQRGDYRALLQALLPLAERSGRLDARQMQVLRELIAPPG